MKTLYLDCYMGAAGDMLTAALLELLPEPEKFVERLNVMGVPDVEFISKKSVKCGITGTHMSVKVRGMEEDEHHHHEHHCDEEHHHHEHYHDEEHHHHEHEHYHDEEHHHHEHHHGGEYHHSDLHSIGHIVEKLNVPESVKGHIMAVYGLIAEAESHAHGVPVTEIHFHEVGTLDAVADIAAVCLLMDELSPDEVVVSPVHVGSGHVHCAHGILPVPAPATAYILRDAPIYSGHISGELCTPTGAALLKHFASRFGDMPVMRVGAIGYGMGRKDFEAANCVRAMMGESGEKTQTVSELSLNVDDMTAEEMGFPMERLFEAGAPEVYTVPVGMKKSRPGTLVRVICSEADREKMLELIFRHTTTIGVRECVTRRYVLNRRIEERETPCGPVRFKVSEGFGTEKIKPEYEDLARIARERGVSLSEAKKLIEE